VVAESLLPAMREGAKFAEEQRLKTAKGPDARQGTAVHQTLGSFIAHANRFKSPASAVWADPARRALVSVLDYHAEGAGSPAAWARHRGLYACPLSDAWMAWGGLNGLTLTQGRLCGPVGCA
jgi:hypothetical protein